ncbi:MAG: sulfurtransferase [Sulfurimonas sp. RIFOXYD12_FULL_33_39]|uniref:ferredoxin-thioredoxin reductase catalytic domain-containing protein n=1 Tax=unclassified Sulfurimonas TaxID=2623549 RepID=UPI0008D6C372|nr:MULTISPECIES: ferredoxin-thioredoxin reductase catalytic domain-containing protein [unclassified Sulfurimonas]OHE10103.1 MAG: sulfurtransferase [Sulfurimonas sp. RIFOXYD12_FULL_33_39]OHE14676.1 MAG: sulfurtransferase [Sulfurimonas sp. RIFOXYD2_FULL_34_21]DAB28389.1 MAG TPA: sulfurtransferase [Sulfurimonas sp. UBA10385]
MSIIKIDINSDEFQDELEKTIKFTDKVLQQFNWVYNPQEEVNEGVQMGLARNKIMYGKRFCPCFMVESVDGKAKSVDDRICPCKPAIEKELLQDGVCHCGIYCTPEYAANKRVEMGMEEVVHTHSRGLTKDEANVLLSQRELDADELTSLLEARELGMVEFKLVDVREHMEWQMGHIKGADKLVPTSSFFAALDDAKLNKDENIIVYCHVGSRSAHCARILTDMGYSKIGNLSHGIVSYGGKIER